MATFVYNGGVPLGKFLYNRGVFMGKFLQNGCVFMGKFLYNRGGCLHEEIYVESVQWVCVSC